MFHIDPCATTFSGNSHFNIILKLKMFPKAQLSKYSIYFGNFLVLLAIVWDNQFINNWSECDYTQYVFRKTEDTNMALASQL